MNNQNKNTSHLTFIDLLCSKELRDSIWILMPGIMSAVIFICDILGILPEREPDTTETIIGLILWIIIKLHSSILAMFFTITLISLIRNI